MNSNAYMRNYNKTHPEVYINRKMNENKIPWIRHYRSAKQRCENPNHKKYNRYGGRGIKFLLTLQEIKFLWFRDKAYEMKQPSIDRKKLNKDYRLANCQFIELKKNSVYKSTTRSFKDSNNNIYESISDIVRRLKIGRQTFYSYLNKEIFNGVKFYEI